MPYPGLDTLYQNMGGAGASYFAGQQMGEAQRAAELADMYKANEIQKQQQDYAQAQLTNPLTVENKALINQGLSAELPGKQAVSRKQQVEAGTAEETQPSDIEAKKATSQGMVDEQKVRHVAATGKLMGVIGAQLTNVPEAAQPALKMQLMQGSGIDPNSNIGKHIMESSPQVLQQHSQAISQLTDNYIRSLAVTHEEGTTRKEVEKMGIEAGKYKKSNMLSWSQKFETMSIDRQMVAIAGALQSGKSPVTGEALDDDEKQYWTTRYQQGQKILDAQNAARAQAANAGIVPTVQDGNVTLQPRAPLPSTGLQPSVPQQQPKLSTEDQQAVDWAKNNPSDPRAKKILKLHGM